MSIPVEADGGGPAYECVCPGGGGYWGRSEHLPGCVSANTYWGWRPEPKGDPCGGAVVGPHYHRDTADGEEVVRLDPGLTPIKEWGEHG